LGGLKRNKAGGLANRVAQGGASQNPWEQQFSLDIRRIYLEYLSRMITYSSRLAARKLGLPVSTLSTYLSVGKIKAPKSVTTGDVTVYLWTDNDIERVRKLLPKIANGRKTRYKKKGRTHSKKKSKP